MFIVQLSCLLSGIDVVRACAAGVSCVLEVSFVLMQIQRWGMMGVYYKLQCQE